VACCFVSFSFLIAGYLFRVMAPLCHSLGCLRLPLVLYLARSWHGVQLCRVNMCACLWVLQWLCSVHRLELVYSLCLQLS
jgi:hypothetical protein